MPLYSVKRLVNWVLCCKSILRTRWAHILFKILNGSHSARQFRRCMLQKRYSQFSQGIPESPVDSTSMFIDQIGFLILCSTISPPPSRSSCLTSFHGNKGKGENPNEFVERSHKDEDVQPFIYISHPLSLSDTPRSPGMLFGMSDVVVNDKSATIDGWCTRCTMYIHIHT